jgi:hypothetical protein
LILEINPPGPGSPVSKGFPDHREIVVIRWQPDDVSDTDPLRIAALESIGDVQRAAPAFAGAAQQTLIPAAGRQLIPDKRGNAPGLADGEPGRTIAARDALPPIPRHERGRRTVRRSPALNRTPRLPHSGRSFGRCGAVGAGAAADLGRSHDGYRFRISATDAWTSFSRTATSMSESLLM